MPLSAARALPPVELRVEALDDEGRGCAEVGLERWRVPGAFPGERAQVEPVARSRHQALTVARLVRVLEPHPARRSAPCPRHVGRGGACTGCALMELEEPAQRAMKLARLRSLGLAVSELQVVGDALGYRWSSKRVVAGAAGALRLGSWARRSHELASMQGCLVDHPLLTRAADAVLERGSALGLEPYREQGQRGDLRYLWLKTNGRQVLLTLVTAAWESRAARELPAQLLDVVDGVAQSAHAGGGNALRGEAARPLLGLHALELGALGAPTTVGPLGFLQPNPAVARACYAALVRDGAGRPLTGRLALDLYAGAGVTTALLRRSFERVVPSESYPESALALGIPAESTEARLERWLAAGEPRPELVTANPPRTGLSALACDELLRLGAPRLHLMSCSAETLVRDVERLRAGYRLIDVQAFDTLPQTPHVELVARLEHVAPGEQLG